MPNRGLSVFRSAADMLPQTSGHASAALRKHVRCAAEDEIIAEADWE